MIFDNLDIRGVNRCIQYQSQHLLDTFTRPDRSGWGNADTGQAWTTEWSLYAAEANISGNKGELVPLTSGADLVQTAAFTLPEYGTMYAKFHFGPEDDEALTGDRYLRFLGTGSAYSNAVAVARTGDGNMYVVAVSGAPSFSLDPTVSDWEIRVEWGPTLGGATVFTQVKVWPAGTTEPADWMSTTYEWSPAVVGAASVGLSNP
jgi:hypothetical protein